MFELDNAVPIHDASHSASSALMIEGHFTEGHEAKVPVAGKPFKTR